MFTTTLIRTSGKLVKNLGWWQFLLLAGLCAWITTPVDAQQGIYPDYGNVPGSRGFMRDDGDDIPEPRSFRPRMNQWDNQEAQPGRSLRRSPQWPADDEVEHIDLRPRRNGGGFDDGYTNRRMMPSSGDEPVYHGRRQHRSNYSGNGVRSPNFSSPDFQSPGYQGPSLPSPDFLGNEDPGNDYTRGGGFPGQSFGRRNFSAPGPQLPGYPSQQTVPRQLQEPVVNPVQETQNRITRRYSNQSFLGLLNLTPQQSLALYSEVNQMIDSRHLEPAPIQARVQKGMTNLIYALDNPAFVQANRLALHPGNVQACRQAWQQAMQTPVQSEQDAINLLNWTMQTSQQQIGLSPAATAMEFIYGAVESLDKYSAFVPPERNPGSSLQLESSLVGIGVQIEMRDQGAEVVKVISGSPAQSAGLRQGDMLLAVSGQQLAGSDVDHAVSLISGPAGSQVVLGIQRGNQGPFTVTATRQSFQVHSVNDTQMLNGTRVGYFKLDKFTATATEEVESALQQLHQQGMQALIMDLRGNPGGLLTAAIQISDKFLPQGTIVATRGRNSADNTEEHATRERTWKVPLVVLVDHNSASASEIFAAAIQENQRGVVVGRTSYGKGTVQTQFPLQTAGCSLRITTAKFYSPNGRVMAGSGVTPDVPVAENSNSMNAAFGVLDQDVMAALNVAQQGNRFQNQNQNLSGLSGLPGLSQPRIPQPFSQPQLVPVSR